MAKKTKEQKCDIAVKTDVGIVTLCHDTDEVSGQKERRKALRSLDRWGQIAPKIIKGKK